MKILFVDTFCHRKNKNGFQLLCEENNIESTISTDASVFKESYDIVMIPSQFINPMMFPNAKRIIYGPHNFVFATNEWKGPQQIFPKHCVYNLLSKWIQTVQMEFGGLSLPSIALPFPVEIQKFCPDSTEKTLDCFLYFKGRKRELLQFAEARLQALGIRYTLLQYGSYQEDEYLKVLRSSRFGVWIGSHESQGFALQEALSTNVPLAVWNVKSMFDEYNRENKISYQEDQRLYKLTATSVPYWDARCGEVFYEQSEFDVMIQKIQENVSLYKPREFILETLSPKACYQRLLTVCQDIPASSNNFETLS
jgi:hypothetical protein